MSPRDDELLRRLDEILVSTGRKEAFIDAVRRSRWPRWSRRSATQRVNHWLNPDAPFHFPLLAYGLYLEMVGVDPLAEEHVAALEKGRARALERENARLRAELAKPRVARVRREREIERRSTG